MLSMKPCVSRPTFLWTENSACSMVWCLAGGGNVTMTPWYSMAAARMRCGTYPVNGAGNGIQAVGAVFLSTITPNAPLAQYGRGFFACASALYLAISTLPRRVTRTGVPSSGAESIERHFGASSRRPRW